jgi:hypothetical protein
MKDRERISKVELELDAYVCKMSIKELLAYHKNLLSKEDSIMSRIHSLFKRK